MFIQNGLFTSESVSAGHPDKLADGIADAIVDAVLEREPTAGVTCEALLTGSSAILTGELKTRDPAVFEQVRVDAPAIVRRVLGDAGYEGGAGGMDPDHYPVELRFSHQHEVIPDDPHRSVLGYVNPSDRINGATGECSVFGYACQETEELMPEALTGAHQLVRRHAEVRTGGELPWLGPDARAQVTFRYEDGCPDAVETVVLCTQTLGEVDASTLRREVEARIIDPVIPQQRRSSRFRLLVKPASPVIHAGSLAGIGFTGRQGDADTYGGAAPGSVGLSGKDPSRIERCGTYMARYLAKQVVARNWARRCLVQIAYARGQSDPVAFLVHAEGASAARNTEIAAALRREFDLSPDRIVRQLNLRQPIYYPTAVWGHLGRHDLAAPWEEVKEYVVDGSLEIAMQYRTATGRPWPTRQIVHPHRTVAPRSPRHYPYLVVRFMNAVYQREEIAIHKGPANMRVGFRDSFVHHPEPFDSDGSISPDCKRLMVAGTLEAIRRTGFRMCLVWTAHSCTFVEKDGSANDSDGPPSGGFGSGGVGGIPLPRNLELEVRKNEDGTTITPFEQDNQPGEPQ